MYIRTGKRLPRRTTEVVMEFRRPPHLPLFPAEAVTLEPYALVARVQEAGFAIHLAKPITFEMLESAIHQVTAGRACCGSSMVADVLT